MNTMNETASPVLVELSAAANRCERIQRAAQPLRERRATIVAQINAMQSSIDEAHHEAASSLAILGDALKAQALGRTPSVAPEAARSRAIELERKAKEVEAKAFEIGALTATVESIDQELQPLEEELAAARAAHASLQSNALERRLVERGDALHERFMAVVEQMAALAAEGQALSTASTLTNKPRLFAPPILDVLTLDGFGRTGRITVPMVERVRAAQKALIGSLKAEGILE